MAHYYSQTPENLESMQKRLGIGSIPDLFAGIPEEIRGKSRIDLPNGRSEYRVIEEMSKLSALNKTGKVSFLGCGSYDHVIPSVVGALASRGEYTTSYTPYQPEISQGLLQTIFEFQTMMAELTGLEVSNASLYDGATAVAEAAVIALNTSRKRDKILYSEGLHPGTKEVLQTFFFDQPVVLEEYPAKDGTADLNSLESQLNESVAGIVVQSPNITGLVEPVEEIAALAASNSSLAMVSANPMSLAVLKPPGSLGADIVVGDTQPLGLMPNYGGPSAGFITTRKKYIRHLPGRVVGESVDTSGRRAFVLTLQAREQHIKRQRATSNICSNQALAAVMNTIYLVAVGPEGLRDAALQSATKARYLARQIKAKTGLTPLGENYFNEFTLTLPTLARELIEFMSTRGYSPGVDLQRLRTGKPGNLITVAVTEKRSVAELDSYVDHLGEFLETTGGKRSGK